MKILTTLKGRRLLINQDDISMILEKEQDGVRIIGEAAPPLVSQVTMKNGSTVTVKETLEEITKGNK